MNPWRRVVFLLALITFLSGCSGYRTVAIPGALPPDEETPPEGDLKVGSSARVWLKSGHKESGEIFEITDQSLTLGKPSNYGLKITTIPFDDIEKIEIPHLSRLESAVFNTLGIAMLVATAGIMLLAWSFRNANFGS